MLGRGGVAVGLLLIACSSSRGPAATAGDAGGDVDAGALEAAACSGLDVFCGGICQPESVSACGPACTTCPQPASSHGQAACSDGKCQFECDPGYDRCATQSCCGNMTHGDVVDIAVGGETSCAVTSAGAIWCWGDDSYGALGDGNTAGLSQLPVQVVNLPSTAVHVVVGGHHTCALLGGGLVACWGDDEQGQLGDGQRLPRGTPVKPLDLASGATHIAAGGSHTCAVSAGGGLFCWGDNTYGQLGNSMTPSSSSTPVAVSGLAGSVTDVAAGGGFTCALLVGGTVQCWGQGANGQTGGTATSSPVPATVPLTAAAISLAAGAKHACAVTMAGDVLCWGDDEANQLGSGHASSHPQAMLVPVVKGAKVVSAGGDETCALDAAGAVTCWGADPVGDTAMGPAGPAVVPSLSAGVAGIGAVAGHACAFTTAGAPKCWGANASGELGDGSMVASWAPIDVSGI
jgi:alpha-tubulin suppressor-like RCC1 family protein